MINILFFVKDLRYSHFETRLDNSEINFLEKFKKYRDEKNIENKKESVSLNCKVSKKNW